MIRVFFSAFFSIILLISYFLYTTVFATDGFFYLYGYKPISTIKDKDTGLYVELSRIDGLGYLSYDVFVFESNDIRELLNNKWQPIIRIGNLIDEGVPILSFDGNCYVVEAVYKWGGYVEKRPKSPSIGGELCFRISPKPTTDWKR